MSQYHLKFSNLIATFTLVFITGIGINIQPVFADDTDIYLDPVVVGSEPLVMFTVDYVTNLVSAKCTISPNVAASISDIEGCGDGYTNELSTVLFNDDAGLDGKISLLEVIRAVLISVFKGLTGVQVGLMMNHRHHANCVNSGDGPAMVECSNGAMVLRGFKSADGTGANNTEFLSILKNIPVPDNPSDIDFHDFQGKEMYFELFRYLTGQDIYNGHNGWRDFDASQGNPGPDDINLNESPDGEAVRSELTTTTPPYAFYPVWDESIEYPTSGPANKRNLRYISPLDAASCAKIYVINIGDSGSTFEADSDDAIEAANTLADQGMDLVLSGSNQFAQVIQFMNDVDLADGTDGYARDTSDVLLDIDGKQNVISYFVETNSNTVTKAWATAGGTGPEPFVLSDDPASVKDAIESIFSSILSVSTTFVAPSVPVNVFNRSEIENQIFLALFEADEDAKPYWPGNLKKLNIVEVTITDPFDASQTIDTIEFQDDNDVQALDPLDGRIKTSALTVWTTTGGNDLSNAVDDADAGVDGRAVKRGGAGQRIPGYLPRNADGTGGTPSLVNQAIGTRGATLGDIRDLWTTDDAVSPSSTLMALDYTVNPTAGDVIDVLWDELTRDIIADDASFPADFATAVTNGDTAAIHQVADALAFIRGFELDASPDTTITGDVRSWILSDPLHSRPLAVNYGARTGYSSTNPDIRLLMGTNDGLMHMIRNTTTTGAESGEEVWAFAPRETMPLWDTLNRNAAQTGPVHPIAVDGASIVYIEDNNNDGTIDPGGPENDKVYLYFGLRRGGKSFYALDISDPDNPEYLFSFSKYSDPLDPTSALNSDFAELSQSWGTPVVGKMNYDGTGATPVLVFGGGYNGDDFGDNVDDDDSTGVGNDTTGLGKDQANRDTSADPQVSPATVGEKDINTAPATSVLEGNSIFIIDAFTGDLVWKAVGITGTDSTTVLHVDTMLDSIPSDISAVDTDGNGLLDRIYAGDAGGNVWRADIPNVTTVAGTPVDPRSSWTVSQLLKAGRHFIANDRDEDRRFFNRPDVVQSSDTTGKFDAVLLGSGDRENPNAEDTTNFFYMIKDRATTSGVLTGFQTYQPHNGTNADALADLTSNCLQDSTKDETSCGIDNLANGWFIKLDDTDGGEKSVTPALTFEGVVFFTTFIPGAGSACGLSEGSGRLFVVNLDDATGVFNFDTSNDTGPAGSSDNYDRTSDNIGGGMGGGAIYGGGNNIINFGSEHTVLTPPGSTQWSTYWYDRGTP